MASAAGEALAAFRRQREVDHQDRVLLHDADQQDDADEGDQRQLLSAQQQRQQGAEAGGRNGGENGERVDIALIEHAQHDVDREDRGDEQIGLGAR